jgi:hypothetical protein
LEKGFSNAIECFNVQAVNGALSSKWLAVSPVPYAIEFLCLCCAKLLVRVHSRLRFQSRRSVLQPRPNRDQVVERMVEFVVKGQQFRGRWVNLLPRAAVVCVTVLNAANIVLMAIFSYFNSKGWLATCSFVFILFN